MPTNSSPRGLVRSGRRSDQPFKDIGAGEVWASGRRAAANANDAAQQLEQAKTDPTVLLKLGRT